MIEEMKTMTTQSLLQVEDGIAILNSDAALHSDASSTLQSWCGRLADGIGQANAQKGIRAVVILIGGQGWPAQNDDDLAILATTAALLENSGKPVVAAMAGPTMDASLELTLACHYRIAGTAARFCWTQIGQGLMPCVGATQRLPRLVGVPEALTMIALGKPVSAADAQASGLIDAVIEGNLAEGSLAWARMIADRPVRRTRDRVVQAPPPSIYVDFLAQHARKFRGLAAPQAIVSLVKAALEGSFEEGLRLESKSFRDLREGPQHAALRHGIDATNRASHIPELDEVVPRPIATTGVIGAGTMGTGIAIALLGAGLPVKLYEADQGALERGVERIGLTFEGNARSGRITRDNADAALASLSPILDMAELASVDLIIEAAYETMEVKQSIFSRLDQIARPGALLASNTSYLDIDRIAQATSRPGDVLGLHFFSPANIMKLLEVVRGKATAPDVLATALAFSRRLGKVAVVSGNAYGFIGNRMLAVRRSEAEAMAVEGASPRQIDQVLERFGFAMGPFRMGDLAGLDLGWSADRSTGTTIRERLCEAGRRGQKTKAGFYDYDEAGKPLPSQATQDILAGFAHDKAIVRRVLGDDEILDRLLWPMVDEGARLLKEGIARNADDIDAVWLNGFGWPAWTGGPMYHARTTGIGQVCRCLEQIGRLPSPALLEWAARET
jgi:3-hydroxyacyl-CoA dehydrogenase